ncbi:MAG: WecB/TagA/CpsF family glycosyltransferase [Dehalococcoidia bacterium]|nr:WecB/TagA/CpsF family glycosyltransferase [Dehalococcoidia bacterium]
MAVNATTFDGALERLLRAPADGSHLRAHFCSVHTLIEATDNPELRAALNDAELIAPDGMPLVWGGRLQGYQVGRVCGPDLMLALLERSVATGGRHYFYGGAEGVPEQLAGRLQQRFPGLVVAGGYSPPFRALTPEEDEAVVQHINEARPDYVWVGLGSPKQDLWVASHFGRLDASVLLAVGAAFDFHTDRVKRAPLWMQRVGLEWFFRLSTEPRRLWKRYTIINARFVALVAADVVRGVAGRIRGPRGADQRPGR